MWKVLCWNIIKIVFYLYIIIDFLRKAYKRVRINADLLLEHRKHKEQQLIYEKVIELQKSGIYKNAEEQGGYIRFAEKYEIFSTNKRNIDVSVLVKQSERNKCDDNNEATLSLLSDNDNTRRPSIVSKMTRKFEENDLKQRTHMNSSSALRKQAGDFFVGQKTSPKLLRNQKVNLKLKNEDDIRVEQKKQECSSTAITEQPTEVTAITNELQNGNQHDDDDSDKEFYEVVIQTRSEMNHNLGNNYNHHNGLDFNENILRKTRNLENPNVLNDTNEPVSLRHRWSMGERDILSQQENEHSPLENMPDRDKLSQDNRMVKTIDEILSQERFSRRLSAYSISDLLQDISIDPDIDQIIDDMNK